MFFHLGKFQTAPVRMNEVTPQGVRHIAYRSADFDYGKNKLSPRSWGDLGFAGFRAHYPLNNREYKDEVAVFLGAAIFARSAPVSAMACRRADSRSTRSAVRAKSFPGSPSSGW